MVASLSSQHLVFSTSTSALQSYEKHVKKDGVTVELLSFSEQSELDAEKLKRKLDETSQSSHVTVLLLLTGASSYLWFDTEHQPRNVELCNLLKQRFPKKLQFVICPTSKATHDAWEAHKPQLQSIFGPFFSGNNVSIWAGFDRDVDSTSPICSLIRKESAKAQTDIVRKQPEAWKSFIWPWSVFALFGLGILYLLWERRKLRTAFEVSQAENQKLQRDLSAAEESLKVSRLASEQWTRYVDQFYLWAPNQFKDLIPDWLQALVEPWLPRDVSIPWLGKIRCCKER